MQIFALTCFVVYLDRDNAMGFVWDVEEVGSISHVQHLSPLLLRSSNICLKLRKFVNLILGSDEFGQPCVLGSENSSFVRFYKEKKFEKLLQFL